MLGCWVDRLTDQTSDGPSKTTGCWLELRALKTLYFYFCKTIRSKINELKGVFQRILQEIMQKIIL